MNEGGQPQEGVDSSSAASVEQDSLFLPLLFLGLLYGPWLLHLLVYLGPADALEMPVGVIYGLFIGVPHLLATLVVPVLLFWRRNETNERRTFFRLAVANLMLFFACFLYST